jgi:hypothetical protein
MLRAGNAGSNTTADHVQVLGDALASLPPAYPPRPDDPKSPRVLIRSDSAGATHGFAAACRDAGVGFSFRVPGHCTGPRCGRDPGAGRRSGRQAGMGGVYPAIEADGTIRDLAWFGRGDRAGRPVRVATPHPADPVQRKERPHPGAQLTFADADGHRITAFITDTPIGVVPGQLAGLDLRHRQTRPGRGPTARRRRPACGTCPATPGRPTVPGWRSSSPRPT